MADKADEHVLEALRRAVSDPTGLPLHGGKAAPGLFGTTAAAKLAAQRCKDEGFLRPVRTETRGKAVHEICAITEKGLAYLLSQVSPKQVLEDFVQALEARQIQVGELVEATRNWQAGLEALKTTAEKVLQQLHQPGGAPGTGVPSGAATLNGSDVWLAEVLAYLAERQTTAPGDCPLPELYRRARQGRPGLTIGHFHDGLRQLHERGQIYLHPWSGPLYDIPEPALALLVGHEVAYYASRR